MEFKLVPVLEEVKTLYGMPRSAERFQQYLRKLQGEDGKDLVLPIAGYNPMGRDIARSKLQELIDLDAEGVASDVVDQVNSDKNRSSGQTFAVVLNLIDDIGGMWSNYYTTDYSNRFQLNALVKRSFCTPYFFTRESYSPAFIRLRVLSQVYRVLHWLDRGAVVTLRDHLEQEIFVCQAVREFWMSEPLLSIQNNGDPSQLLSKTEHGRIEAFKKENMNTADYSHLFNFFYGDEASLELSYPIFGIPRSGGLRYIWWHVLQNKSESIFD